ncbi:biliverdin-producing heme oxygenase [Halomonas sp. TRM85114]|uniref:biliverdin-producing heme oxygenase n=1 Tax=Halomonas jincaotanensis TaxID=2810616 RepID=UPI001BD25624|nr:biliverdin-producing heme oxygenase [Halomonas jincaotanensis]MBS9403419.1 biliverdin-producing heme oxygenase [Halomonas jincaotanensis]
MCSLLARLREATHHDHHRLDRHPRLSRLLKSDLDPESYVDALVGLHGAQSSLEDAVRRGLESRVVVLPAGEGYRLDERAPALRDDLERLGGKPFDGAFAPLAVPRLETLLGLLYVLEGSRLGARVIAKHVRASLGPTVPLRFFAEAHGATHWPSFITFAERLFSERAVAEPRGPVASADEAALGARAAFALFQHSLDTSPAILSRKDHLGRPLVGLEGAK